MKNIVLALVLVSLIPVLIVAGALLVDWEEAEEEPEETVDKLYSIPLSVGEEPYIVTVRSNYSSAPEVSYASYPPLLSYFVSVDFRGDPENSFCNVTIPTDLIWGSISVIAKVYTMDADLYSVSNNATHNCVYFTFNHPDLVKHFEIRGTKGVLEYPSSSPSPRAVLAPESYEIADGYIRFYAFTIHSPLNKTYASKPLTLDLSFTAGRGIRYSLYYHLDGRYVNDIPFSVEGASEMHITYPATGSTQLPTLSEGSHTLTVFLDCEGMITHPSLYTGTVFFTIDSREP